MKNNSSHLINKYFRKSFKFHSCLSFDRKLLIKFPEFYRNILFQWSNSLFSLSELPYVLISIFSSKKTHCFRYFSGKGLNFDNNGNVKPWSSIKEEFGFNTCSNFKWQQLIYALSHFWKKMVKETDIADNLLLPKHHLIKKH